MELGSVFVESVVKRACVSVEVTDQEKFGVVRGRDAVDGAVNELVDSGCFVDDDEDVAGVESLETIFGVC